MPLLNCSKISISILTIITIIGVQFIILSFSSFQTKARIMRANFVLGIQVIMLTFSLLVWRTFKDCMFADNFFSSIEEFISGKILGRFKFKEKSMRKSSESDLTAGAELIQNRRWTLWKIVLFFYLLMCHTSYLTNLYFIGKDPYWIGLITYACLGSFIQLNTGLLIIKTVSQILNILKIKKTTQRLSYYQLSSNQKAIFSSVFMLCASVYGLYNASQPPVVKDVKISIRDLPIGLNGLKIVQLSDIHLGPTVGFSKLSKIVTIVNEEKADVVVLTGDLVDGSVVFLQDAAVPLKSIQSKYGNYFVTGNHEYYTGDVDNWFIALASLGFKVLHNSHVFIPEKNANGQEHICLAGTDDIQANLIGYGDHKFDLAKAVGNCSKQRPVILLAHQPKAAKIALDSSYRIDLVLSGHTHGGQMFPMVIAAYLLNPFFAGLYKYGPNSSFVYVSQGTQYWGIPMRIATTMEITRITLQSAN